MVTGLPSIQIFPDVGVSVPDRILTSVLLPAPLSPIRATTSPARTSKLAPDSALTWPYTFVMPRASSASLIDPLLIDHGVDGDATAESVARCRNCVVTMP